MGISEHTKLGGHCALVQPTLLPTPYEYLATFIKKHSLDPREIEKITGLKMEKSTFRSQSLPCRDTLIRLKSYMNTLSEGEGTLYEDLVIDQSLRAASHTRNPLSQHKIINELPQRYWRAVIDELHAAVQSHPFPDEPNPPRWMHSIIPIETPQDYLHAVRLYLHLPVTTVSERIGKDESGEAIRAVERNTSSHYSETAVQLAGLYAKIQNHLAKKDPAAPLFFDAALYANFDEVIKNRPNGRQKSGALIS